MPSDKSEPIRITGSRFVDGSVVLVDLIKSVGIDIYTPRVMLHCVKRVQRE